MYVLYLLLGSWFPDLDVAIISHAGEDVQCLFRGSYIMNNAFVAFVLSNGFLHLELRLSYLDVPVDNALVRRCTKKSVSECPSKSGYGIAVSFEYGNVVVVFVG